MTKQEFLRRVQERLGLTDIREAETATRVVLAATADRIRREEALDLASQLPRDLGNLVRSRRGPLQKMDPDTFIQRIQGDLDVTTFQQALAITRGVFSVLKEAVTPGEWEDVASQLPKELQEEFVRA
ncbi:MAG: DUF2267 domain-containing protein [Anaerolineae bacterium]